MSESLDNADTALTIVPAAAAVAGAALTKVAPQGVRKSINNKKTWLKTKWKKFEDTHPRLFFVVNTLNAFFNFALYFADIYTDIILLLDFIKYGWVLCSVWSVCFLVAPYAVAVGGIFITRKNSINFIDWDDGYGKIVFYCFFPLYPFLLDLLMPFYRLMDKWLPDTLMNFMAQYEATRTLSETVLESIPQLGLQVYMVLLCRSITCAFVEEDASALLQAFTVSMISITYRLVLTWFEIHAENMTVKQYVGQLVKMGGGLPLAAIAHNQVEDVRIDFELSLAQVRLLAGVLRTNTSVKILDLSNCGIDDEKMNELQPVLYDKLNQLEKCYVLGSQLNLAAVAKDEEVNIEFELSLAQVRLLAGVLRTNSSVNKLNIDGWEVPIGDLKTKATLYFPNKEIDDKKLMIMCVYLKVNTSLEMIDLDMNNIGDEGAKDLAEALKVNTSLK